MVSQREAGLRTFQYLSSRSPVGLSLGSFATAGLKRSARCGRQATAGHSQSAQGPDVVHKRCLSASAGPPAWHAFARGPPLDGTSVLGVLRHFSLHCDVSLLSTLGFVVESLSAVLDVRVLACRGVSDALARDGQPVRETGPRRRMSGQGQVSALSWASLLRVLA